MSKKHVKRNNSKMRNYKDWVNYVCQHPDCDSGKNIEVHHVMPIKQGGKDEYWNYISLCFRCHRYSKLHRGWEERMTELFTFKAFWELEHFGFVLDEKDQDYFSNLKKLLSHNV